MPRRWPSFLLTLPAQLLCVAAQERLNSVGLYRKISASCIRWLCANMILGNGGRSYLCRAACGDVNCENNLSRPHCHRLRTQLESMISVEYTEMPRAPAWHQCRATSFRKRNVLVMKSPGEFQPAKTEPIDVLLQVNRITAQCTCLLYTSPRPRD